MDRRVRFIAVAPHVYYVQSTKIQKDNLRPNNLYHFISVAEIAVVIRLRLGETRENADKSAHITCPIIVCTICGNSIVPKTGFGETRPKYICAALSGHAHECGKNVYAKSV